MNSCWIAMGFMAGQ